MTDLKQKLPPNMFACTGGYYFNPPKAAQRAGVYKPKYFRKDKLEEGIRYAMEGNAIMAEWRKTYRRLRRIVRGITINHLIEHYFYSSDFNSLGEATKAGYRGVINKMRTKMVQGTPLGDWQVEKMTPPLIASAYEKEVKDSGVNAANDFIAMYRLLYNHGIRHGFHTYNPFSYVKKQSSKPRKVMWKRVDVRAFLNTAFSKWEWRNVGIVFYCLYEWGQRPGDICRLCWDQIDMEKKIVTITQSKRGATVRLPISDGLMSVFKQQKAEFFEKLEHKYVAPQMVRRNGKWVPYTSGSLNNYFDAICEAAKLPKTLQLRDLRRTAITETIENGADALQVMMLSGHQSVASLQPYFVHTLKGAQTAQTIRDFPATLIEGGMVKKRYGFQKEKPNAQPVQA